MLTAKIKFVWDRHHRAESRQDKSGSIELRVSYENKYKYIATGIFVEGRRWDDATQSVVGILEAASYNITLSHLKAKVAKIIAQMQEEEGVIDLSAIQDKLETKVQTMTFWEFIELRIEQEKRFKSLNNTKNHNTFLRKLKEWGKIKNFSDLTHANIIKMDEYLKGRKLHDETIYGYHKHLRKFINDAVLEGYVNENPYSAKGIKLKHGAPNVDKYITEEELQRIIEVDLSTERLSKVRDLFVFQCYTGMAYADIMSFDFTKAKKQRKILVLDGKRVKTNIPYHFVILEEAKKVLEKYNFSLPHISNQKYNDYLKLLADKCDIEKRITSHYGRRTAGMIMLNNGVPIGVVSRILGHASVRTTEKAYAFLLDKTIDDAMLKFAKKMKSK